MAKPITSKKRAERLSLAVFLIGLAILAVADYWWPGILLIVGLSLGLRQFLQGRRHDTILSVIIFLGAYILETFSIPWSILLPALFLLGAFYLIIKEFFINTETEVEKELDINKEIEEHENE